MHHRTDIGNSSIATHDDLPTDGYGGPTTLLITRSTSDAYQLSEGDRFLTFCEIVLRASASRRFLRTSMARRWVDRPLSRVSITAAFLL